MRDEIIEQLELAWDGVEQHYKQVNLPDWDGRRPSRKRQPHLTIRRWYTGIDGYELRQTYWDLSAWMRDLFREGQFNPSYFGDPHVFAIRTRWKLSTYVHKADPELRDFLEHVQSFLLQVITFLEEG